MNKLKELLKLETMFKHFNIYFKHHLYAQDIFHSCVINVHHLWQSVCLKIKKIAKRALRCGQIKDEEYLLITEADTVQDYLQLFINCSHLTKCLPDELKLRSLNLLMPEV